MWLVSDPRTYVITVESYGIPEEAQPAFRRALRISVEAVLLKIVAGSTGVAATYRLDDVDAILAGDDE